MNVEVKTKLDGYDTKILPAVSTLPLLRGSEKKIHYPLLYLTLGAGSKTAVGPPVFTMLSWLYKPYQQYTSLNYDGILLQLGTDRC